MSIERAKLCSNCLQKPVSFDARAFGPSLVCRLEPSIRNCGRPRTLVAKDHLVSYKVGVLGHVARACDSSDVLLDWPGAGIHLHICDNETMSLGNTGARHSA
eukprot:4814685-Amphidinium_carterae.1